jgi:hypothetical protein
MNIQTVKTNLEKTIAGKEQMLEETIKARENNDLAQTPDSALYATIAFLQINIAELRRILQDVEQCAKQAADDSWITNPDRSGGQFTQDEIDNANRW